MNKVEAMCLAMFILNAAVVVVIGILSVIAYKKKEIYPEQLAVIIIHNMVCLWGCLNTLRRSSAEDERGLSFYWR